MKLNHHRMTRREVATEEPAKRRRNGRKGEGTGRVELCIVPRAELSAMERFMHVRRLRKTRRLSKRPMAFSEADA